MGVKFKLVLGIASLIIGVALLGGTFAYFSDIEEFKTNPIKTGTLQLGHDLTTQMAFNITDLKPGDKITRVITFTKSGTIKISELLLKLNYTSADNGDDGVKTKLIEDLKISVFKDSVPDIIDAESIADLALSTAITPINISDGVSINTNEGEEITIEILYENNTTENQNHQQNDSVSLTFTFEAKQSTDDNTR
jgi:spore coat-associated protein N